MSWYVFALVDAAPSGAKGRGLSGPLALLAVPGGFAVVERRADVPPVELGSLERHQDVLTRLVSRVPAIIPVRFGTLLDEDEIDERLGEREAEIAEAFAAVRDRVQFTWRRRGRAAKSQERGTGTNGRGANGETSGSGTEYLRRAASAAKPAIPAAWRAVRAGLAALIAAERYQSASGPVPESLYHLVARDAAALYQERASALRDADPKLRTTGPWPAFAFVPDML
jgi:hypothetical protein